MKLVNITKNNHKNSIGHLNNPLTVGVTYLKKPESPCIGFIFQVFFLMGHIYHPVKFNIQNGSLAVFDHHNITLLFS